MNRAIHLIRCAGCVTALALAVPVISQNRAPLPNDPAATPATKGATDLGQPEDPAAKRGFIRRQVGRIDNPDARTGQPLTSPAPSPGSTQPPLSDAPQPRSPQG